MSYKSAVLADGPLGFWRLGNSDFNGTTAFDGSGFARTGTYSGTYTQGASTLQADGDSGLTLAGAGYVTMGDVAAFEFTGAFSAEAWINTTSAAAGSIVGKFAAANIGWLVFMVAGGTIRFLAFTAGSVSVFSFDTPASYNDGRWHHVVCTWDGTTGANKVQIYVDGVVVKQGTASAGTPGTGADPFVIGANASTFQNKITASLDEVAVYGSELTATRIAAHYDERPKLTSSDYSLLVNSVDVSTKVRWDSVEITDVLNEAPNTASAVVEKFVPVIGQTLEVRVVDNTVFKGTITGSTQLQTRSSTRTRYRLDAMDGMYLLDRRLVNRDFVNWSATSIANNIISSFTTGFTAVNVATSLVAVDLPNKMETVSQALTRLANLAGGFWYLDYLNDLHLRTTELLGDPQALTSTKAFRYRDLAYSRTLPRTTRVSVEGQGAATTAAVAVSATTISLETAVMFASGGGTATAPGGQILTYTGTSALAAPSAPTTSATGVGKPAGAYKHLVTYLDDAERETAAGAASGGATASSASTPGQLNYVSANPGGGLTAGTYYWVVTFAAPGGLETAASTPFGLALGASGYYVTLNGFTSVPAGCTTRLYRTLVGGSDYFFVAEFGGAPSTYNDSTADANLGPAPGAVTGIGQQLSVTSIPTSADTRVKGRRLYRTKGGGSTYFFLADLGDNTTTTYTDNVADSALGKAAPAASTFPGLLTGVTGVTVALDPGDLVSLLVIGNDTGAQTVLAALEGGDGIHETYIQDGRLSIDGATARGDAELTLGSDPEAAITVTSEDPFMISGRTLTVNVGSITSVTARIQQVQTTWPRDRKLPQRQVTATNVFKTLYQYLRDLDDRSSVD